MSEPQQIINVGEVANDGTGESLRDAFNAVNNNFANVWAAGPVNSQVVISNNRISTNETNLDLVLAGNGIGTVTVASTTVPSIDAVYDLGQANRRFDEVHAVYYYGNGAYLTGINANGGSGGNVYFSQGAPDDASIGDIWIESDTGVQYLYFNDNTSNQWAEMEAYQSFSSTSANADTGNWAFTNNVIYNINGGSIDNSDLTHGPTALLSIPTNGNAITPVTVLNYYGNITLVAAASPGNTKSWTFDSSGNLTLPGNTFSVNYANGTQVNIGGGSYGNANVADFLADFGANNISTTGSVTANTFQTNGNLVIGDIGFTPGSAIINNGNSFLVFAQGVNAAASMGWAENIFAPGNLAYIDFNTNQTGNISIITGNNVGNTYQWTFDKDGTLYFPVSDTNIQQQRYGMGNLAAYLDGGWTIGEYNGTNSGTEGIRINPGIEGPADIILPADAANVPVSVNNYIGGVIVNAGNGTVQLSAGANSWLLNSDASVQFPQIYTARGDTTSGNIYGYTLVMGDGENEAIITTPNGIGGDSVRLVINPGKGADGTSGEGGDIYLWAGRGGSGDVANLIGGGSGGDIKIRGGQGMAGGEGGYIRIEAGDGDNQNSPGGYPGFIEITGGQGGNAAPGGYVRILAGTGDIIGGDANISAGTGLNGPGGNVNISSGGGATAGNVNVTSAGNTWTFDNSGNLTLPGGGIVYGNPYTPSGAPGNTITLQPAGSGTVTDQRLLIYPTAADGDHIHLTSGNLYQTELFLGSDNLYVKLANTGNVVVNANDNNGNSFQYVFGADSTITFPDSGLSIDSGYYSGNAGFVAGSGVAAVMTELYSSGNTAAQILLNRPQIDHTIQLSLYPDSADPATTWTFDDTGNLTAPGNIMANTFVSNAFNVVTAGNLSITSQYGLGFTGTILEDNGTLELLANGTGGCVIVGWDSSYGNGLGNIAAISFNQVAGGEGNVVVRTGNIAATEYNWNFDSTGNLTLPGNSFAVNYANGNPVTLSGSYGDSNVVSLMGAFGSNAISTTGNVSANNLIATGNANVLTLTTRNGDSNNSYASPQIIMGYAGTADYPSFIHTTHNAGTPVDNTIEFWTNDGTQFGTFPANAVLGLTVTNGNIETGGILTDNYYYANGTPVSFGGGGSGTVTNIQGNGVVSGLSLTGNVSTTGNLTLGGTLNLSNVSGNITTTGNITSGNIIATANVLGNGYARFAGTFDESQAATAGLYLGYAGGTPRMMFGTGNTLQTFEIDNDGGNLRFYQPGVTKATLNSNGNFSAVGNITGNYILGNGSQLTGLPATYGNSNVTTLLGALGSNNISTTGTVSTGNITGGNVLTGGLVSATANVTGGNILTGGLISAAGNVTAQNFIGNISITGNVTGTSANVTLVAGSYSTVVSNDGNVTAPSTGYLQGGTLKSTNSTGNEGGELQLALAPNATISGSTVSFDSYVNRVRIFEGGGNARGVYIDLSKAPDGVGGELSYKASGFVDAGVDVTLGNLRARIPTSGNRSLQVSTVSGTYSISGSEVYYAGGVGGSYIDGGGPLSVTTTPTYLRASNSFNAAGQVDTWNIMDTSAGLAWRITCIIGVSYNNNMISIERLV